MEDLASRGAPLEYWFFRTAIDDLALLVDVIVRGRERQAETRVVARIGDHTEVTRVSSPTWSGDADGIRAGENLITASASRGRVGETSWNLAVDLGPDRICPMPPALAWLRIYDMQIVSAPTASVSGTITVADRTWSLDSRPAMVSHYWGRALPPRWTWASVIGTADEPRMETTVLNSRVWGTPLVVPCGYVWRSGAPGARPTVTVMPLNGLVRSVREGSGARVLASRPFGAKSDLACTADAATFADLGEGIRQSLTATVVIDGRPVEGALEFRG